MRYVEIWSKRGASAEERGRESIDEEETEETGLIAQGQPVRFWLCRPYIVRFIGCRAHFDEIHRIR